MNHTPIGACYPTQIAIPVLTAADSAATEHTTAAIVAHFNRADTAESAA